jgi:hypothetical protein
MDDPMKKFQKPPHIRVPITCHWNYLEVRVEPGNKGFLGIHSLILYRVRNSFEALPGFGGPAEGSKLEAGPNNPGRAENGFH